MQEDGEVQCVPQGDLILAEKRQRFEFCDVTCYVILYVITTVVAIYHISCIVIRFTQINEKIVLNFDETGQSAVMIEPELASACISATPYTFFPALKDCYDRWSPRSWTK